MEQVIPLPEAQIANVVGGKAASLGELLRSGIRVPNGFVVVGGPHGIEDLILEKFDNLQASFVAVRSSAIAEDGAEDAWAGQLDTYLNIGRTNLIEHIRRCMESSRSARAVAYAEQKHIEPGEVAVIVQAMVDSDVSGVAFSVHPVTKSAEHMVIEAGLGLGDAIVSGEITPDTYVLKAKTGQIVEQLLSTQTKQLLRTENGDTEWQTIDPPMHRAKMTEEQLQELSEVVRRIAAHNHYPVDVEWGFSADMLYILQARPITAL